MTDVNRPQTEPRSPHAAPTSPWRLEAQGLTKTFGGIRAVDQVSLHVPAGSITGLIGPNGAGKTTLFNLLSNFSQPDHGIVRLNGVPIHTLRPHQMAKQGLVRTFQVARVLSRLSVLDNLLLAAPHQAGENFWRSLSQPHVVRQQEARHRDRAQALLDAIGLGPLAQDYAGSLSGGQRKLLELGRALMVEPQLVLLDEPTAGVNPTLVQQMCQHIRDWNQAGITFLIIEHNMDVIMSLCDRVWVLAEGRNLADGTPAAIQTHPQVLAAYLGL